MVSASRLGHLARGWEAAPGPRYRLLAQALEFAIARGDLAADEVLPPERALASELGLARSTVVNAYGELRERGLVVSRRGSGTRVLPALPEARSGQTPRATDLGAPPLVDLATAGMSAAPEVIAALRLVAGAPDATVFGAPGYWPAGLPALRAAIAAYLTAGGLPTDPEEVMVTSGDQQSLALVGELLTTAATTVLVEDVTFPGLLEVARARGARIVGAPTLVEDAEAFARALGRRPVVASVAASVGARGLIASLTARETVVAAAADHDVVLIDDVGQSDVAFGPVPPPLAALGAGTVITVGSLSKLFWGGLRIGWIRARRPEISRLVAIKSRQDLGTSALSQLVALELMTAVDGSRRSRVEQLRSSLDLAVGLLGSAAPDLPIVMPEGGLSLWLDLPHHRAHDVVAAARSHGVAIVDGAAFSPGAATRESVRVVFARADGELRDGIDRLAAAWRSLGHPDAAGSVVV